MNQPVRPPASAHAIADSLEYRILSRAHREGGWRGEVAITIVEGVLNPEREVAWTLARSGFLTFRTHWEGWDIHEVHKDIVTFTITREGVERLDRLERGEPEPIEPVEPTRAKRKTRRK